MGGQLLRFRSGQQHAVVQGVQKALLADPAPAFPQFAVHQGNLPGRGPPNWMQLSLSQKAQGGAEEKYCPAGAAKGSIDGPAEAEGVVTSSKSPACAPGSGDPTVVVPGHPLAGAGTRGVGASCSGSAARTGRGRRSGYQPSQAERQGQQTGRFRREVQRIGVGTTHNAGQSPQCG